MYSTACILARHTVQGRLAGGRACRREETKGDGGADQGCEDRTVQSGKQQQHAESQQGRLLGSEVNIVEVLSGSALIVLHCT